MNQNNDNHEIDLSGKVKFEDEKFRRSARSSISETPKIVQLVIKYSGGYIRDEKQSRCVILGFVALAIIISLSLIFGGGGPELPSEREIMRDTPTTPIQ